MGLDQLCSDLAHDSTADRDAWGSAAAVPTLLQRQGPSWQVLCQGDGNRLSFLSCAFCCTHHWGNGGGWWGSNSWVLPCTRIEPLLCSRRKPPPLAAVSVQADCRVQGHLDSATPQGLAEASAGSVGDGLPHMSIGSQRQGHSSWQVRSFSNIVMNAYAALLQCTVLTMRSGPSQQLAECGSSASSVQALHCQASEQLQTGRRVCIGAHVGNIQPGRSPSGVENMVLHRPQRGRGSV